MKREGETYREFYTSKDFKRIAEVAYPLCQLIKSLPHDSKLVIDDLYNPKTGYYAGFIFEKSGSGIFNLLKPLIQEC